MAAASLSRAHAPPNSAAAAEMELLDGALTCYRCAAEHFILGVGESTPAMPPAVTEFCRQLCAPLSRAVSLPLPTTVSVACCSLAAASFRCRNRYA